MKTPVEVIQTLFPLQDAIEIINRINKADYYHTMCIIGQDKDAMRRIVNDMDVSFANTKGQWRIETSLTPCSTDFLILISPETWEEELLHQYLQKMHQLNPLVHIWLIGTLDDYYDDDFVVNVMPW